MRNVMRQIQAHPALELQVILGGSVVLEKYGRIFESDLVDQIPVNQTINFVIEGETPTTMAKSSGLAVTEFAGAFESLKPDVVIVVADRYECLAITMAAAYMNIPVAHVEGGEVTGSIDESIRHAITKLAHVHFPASEEAAERIARMGEPRDSIFVVGSTSFDVLKELDLNNLAPIVTHQKLAGVGETVVANPREYLIVIQHPVTTEYEKNLAHVSQTTAAIDLVKMPTFWIWPNMDAGSDGISKGIRLYRERSRPSHVHFFKSLPIELFGPLLNNAACIVGNSSSGIREAAFLGTPTVNIGSRQEGRRRGRNVIDVGYSTGEIVAAIMEQVRRGPYESDKLYGSGDAAGKIVPVLADYNFNVQKRIVY